MDRRKLIKVELEKDLGVIVKQSLKPSSRVGKAAKKANQALGQLLRAFTFRDKFHFIHLFRTYVRCHLEYAVATWSPWTEQDRNVLEDVQRRAIRQVRGLEGSYEEKLKQCGLTTLIERRERGDMIQTFKIIHQIDDIPVDSLFEMAGDDHQHGTRQAVTFIPEQGHFHIHTEEEAVQSLKLAKPKNVKDLEVRRNFFSQRVVDPWNDLPLTVKTASSVNNFKNLYDKFKL